jgi:hypothetical protein
MWKAGAKSASSIEFARGAIRKRTVGQHAVVKRCLTMKGQEKYSRLSLPQTGNPRNLFSRGGDHDYKGCGGALLLILIRVAGRDGEVVGNVFKKER